MGTTTETASELIAAERQRQIEKEGYDFAHDDAHTQKELKYAGMCYLGAYHPNHPQNGMWPWNAMYWKPRDRKHNLIRAGALFMAESERLKRLASNLSGMYKSPEWIALRTRFPFVGNQLILPSALDSQTLVTAEQLLHTATSELDSLLRRESN